MNEEEDLQVLEDDFYAENYYSIRKRVLTPHFIPSIQHLLIARNIKTDNVEVGTVAETLLHQLKSVRKVFDAITEASGGAGCGENWTAADGHRVLQRRTLMVF